MRVFTCSLVVACTLVGCANHPASPDISMKPLVYVDEMPTRVNENMASNPGSLFGQGDNPLFADLKAMHVNDIVTITITEQTVQTSSGNKALSKESSSDLNAGMITGVPFGGAIGNVADKIATKSANLGFSAGSTNSFTGTGSTSRNESFNTTISARIIKTQIAS